ncbi:transmembrane protein 26-like, partial [Pleurodeles waltl]|uniref:transmembrane protein 26-like n=1 Tax=Pleurodeles waltl TaxID=8319 RepID=UPI003709C5AE
MTCKTLSALASRLIFTAHGFLLVWIVVHIKGDDSYYWLLLIGLGLLYLEMPITLRCTKKGEWKWFSPMVFLYLCTSIPSVALLELELLNRRSSSRNSSSTQTSCNTTEDGEFGLSNWVKGLEQIMLLILVIVRWLMPKGEMTRDQLSQLLLVYIGMGADIMDILEVFTEPEVETNMNITITGLALFSWALMQFTLVLTQTDSPPASAPNRSVVSLEDSESPAIDPEPKAGCCRGSSCCINEVWGLAIAVGMQDGPFLIFRLYLMLHEKVLNQMMIFFAVKNVLTVLIEIYRIVVVQCSRRS